ncbi:MAG: TlpA disulfide reductase family protein [Prosthecobacter sp.]|uniref:peroxiredoxin family protein n=1 Tax=Prosthecobacter sp. TaxID=1965333 RepID=UPI003BB0C5EF
MKSFHPMLYGLMLLAFLTFSRGTAAEDVDVDEDVKRHTLVQVGETAPDFNGKTTDGRTMTLSALKGKVVVVYFFSTQVAPCIAEMKHLQSEVYEKLRNRDDFQLIGIGFGKGSTREELVILGGENKFTFPLVPDPGRQIYERYFTKYAPRTVVIGKTGVIRHLASGYHELTSIPKLQAALARELAVNTP